MSDLPLDRTIEDLEPAILDRWSARLADTGLAAHPADVPDRAGLRALLAEVREELRTAPASAVRIPLRLQGTPATPARAEPLLRPRDLLALTVGPEAVREVLGSAPDAGPALGEAFRRVFDRHGEVACARCRLEQDTARHQVEDRLRTAIEHARDAILTCEPGAGITAWNRGAEALFGLPAARIEGLNLTALVPPEKGAAWAANLVQEVRSAGHVRIAELELVTGDRGRVWVDASFSRVRGAEGEDAGMWVVLRDITEQRRLLQQSLDAERLALIGTMSAKFAHEIRNPLASIQLNVELIGDALKARAPAEGAASEDDESLVRAIASEVQRIRNVVQEYLRFGRLPTVQRANIELDGVLAQGLGVLAPELKARGVRLETDLAAPGRTVLADGDQVWQAVHNLVGNAMEAMSRGGTLKVSTMALPTSVRCTVEDDGPGIPAELRDRIFAPFFSTKRAGTGSGCRSPARSSPSTARRSSSRARRTARASGSTCPTRRTRRERTGDALDPRGRRRPRAPARARAHAQERRLSRARRRERRGCDVEPVRRRAGQWSSATSCCPASTGSSC
jgi:PAS domain S-box-containing protein